MRRPQLALLFVLAVTLTLVSGAPGVHGAARLTLPSTSLTIQVFDLPLPAPPNHTYHLRCAPAAGDVPHPLIACRRLYARVAPFAAPPLCRTVDVIRARVFGRYRGHGVLRTYIPCAAQNPVWAQLAALLGIPPT
jgi:hypothetical protein